jgi:hypothetical protein
MKILKNYNFLDVATGLEKRLYDKLLNSSFFRDKIEFVDKKSINFLYKNNLIHVHNFINLNEDVLKDPVVLSIYKNTLHANISKGNPFLKQIMDNDLINFIPIICLLEKNEPIGHLVDLVSITSFEVNNKDLFEDFSNTNLFFKYEKFSTIFKDKDEN